MTDDLLIDDLYRMTFGPPVPDWKYKNKKMRDQVFGAARRFVLDKAMSAFLADIAFAVCNKRTKRLSLKGMDFARRSARLPHDMTWIEYDVRAYEQREIEIAGELINFEAQKGDVWLREGWLLNGFQQYDQEFRVHLFRSLVRNDVPMVYACPFAVNWRTDETDVAFFNIDGMRVDSVQTFMADVVLGATGWGVHSRAMQVQQAELVHLPADLKAAFERGTVTVGELLHLGVMTGLMRRVWTLLSTINDLPVTFMSPTRLAHGFKARAQYRRFLEHKVITLTIPQNVSLPKIARSVVAAAKRRAHMVRGHWRKDWRHPDLRIWIKEHMRGDMKLGIVTHDYKIVH